MKTSELRQLKQLIKESIQERKEWETLSELSNDVYHAEELIDGSYFVGMFGDKHKDLDELYTETLSMVRKLDKLLVQIVEKIKI
jgi:hypothetical protein